jgi:streptogramin lyase
MKSAILFCAFFTLFGCLGSGSEISAGAPSSFNPTLNAPQLSIDFNTSGQSKISDTDTAVNDLLGDDFYGVSEEIEFNDQQDESLEQDTIENSDLLIDTPPESENVGPVCQDDDGDGYGPNCEAGPDCDDYNPNFTVVCPNCTKNIVPGCACSGKSAPCYSSDPLTKGIGQCKAGTHACVFNFWQECKGEVLPTQEICDGKDNDCDGVTDDGVKSSCGGCDFTCVQKTIGSAENPIFLNSENSTGVGLDPQGQIVIDSTQISLNLKFIWIANSPQNTVSKVDCKVVKEVGRYPVCADPSRTSVDLEGNVWVACRGDGQVAKIMAETKNCVDKNSNGIIETSSGNNIVPNDECVKFIVQPNKGSLARGAAVDKFNNVWIGYWNAKSLVQLSAKDGAVLKDVGLGCSPYGLVIDQKGHIWGQGASCGSLILYNPDTGQVFTGSNMPSLKYPAGAYGLNVDVMGRIWVASGGAASVYTPGTATWQVINMGWGGGRGVATSNDGFIYVAVDSSGGAVKINGLTNPPQVEGFIKGAGSPVGVAIDYDGFVWVVNQSGSSATKMDPKNMSAVGTVGVGPSPYTYSDMTGYTLNYFTAPKGQYTATFFATGVGGVINRAKFKVTWHKFYMDAVFPPATKIVARYRAADDQNALVNSAWTQMPDFTDMSQLPYDMSQKLAVGLMLQVEITLVTDDKKVSPAVKSLSAKAKLL